eukprot:gene17972-19768_t
MLNVMYKESQRMLCKEGTKLILGHCLSYTLASERQTPTQIGLLINGKREPLREIASLPVPDTESEEDVDAIVLCDKNSKQNLISGCNDEPELVESEVLIKQIYVKNDSLPTNSNDSVSEWKQKMNLKQSLTVELASTSADTGIECDGSIDANLNQLLRTNSKDLSEPWVDAASPTNSFQIPKQNSKHSSLAKPLKECKIEIPLHADECDEQSHDKARGNNEDTNVKNGVKDVASTGRMENECDNNKNAFRETDVYQEVPKHEEYDDSDVESQSSSITIGDIDSDDGKSLWEVTSTFTLRSVGRIALDNDDQIFGKHGSVEYIIRRYVGDTASATTTVKTDGKQGLVESGAGGYEHPTEQSDFSVLDVEDSVASNKGITTFGQESKSSKASQDNSFSDEITDDEKEILKGAILGEVIGKLSRAGYGRADDAKEQNVPFCLQSSNIHWARKLKVENTDRHIAVDIYDQQEIEMERTTKTHMSIAYCLIVLMALCGSIAGNAPRRFINSSGRGKEEFSNVAEAGEEGDETEINTEHYIIRIMTVRPSRRTRRKKAFAVAKEKKGENHIELGHPLTRSEENGAILKGGDKNAMTAQAERSNNATVTSLKRESKFNMEANTQKASENVPFTVRDIHTAKHPNSTRVLNELDENRSNFNKNATKLSKASQDNSFSDEITDDDKEILKDAILGEVIGKLSRGGYGRADDAKERNDDVKKRTKTNMTNNHNNSDKMAQLKLMVAKRERLTKLFVRFLEDLARKLNVDVVTVAGEFISKNENAEMPKAANVRDVIPFIPARFNPILKVIRDVISEEISTAHLMYSRT